jgi:thiosulfate dehydrogenase [quinone] large subunit
MMDYSNRQTWALLLLQLAIGWHLLYEGVAKIANPDWSAAGYLLDSGGWFAGLFHALAANDALLGIINGINSWGLAAIGLALVLGLFTRVALVAGIVLLGLYFLSHPPLIDVEYALPSEGNYLWVNKTLIELLAMGVLLVFPVSHIIGLDRLIAKRGRLQAHV